MRFIRNMLCMITTGLFGLFLSLTIMLIPKPKNEESAVCDDECLESELHKVSKRMHFTGSCHHVNNFMPHPAANRDYYVVALRNSLDVEKTDIYMFTERELINAQERANKNREDIPEDIADFDMVIDRGED